MIKIVSPLATGSGAHVLHKNLEKHIPGYSVKGYNPYLTLMPLSLKAVRIKGAGIIHTTPDYACFFIKPKVPSVITFHGYTLDSWIMPYSTLLQRIHCRTDLRLFTRLAVSKASTITAVSRYMAALARKDLGISGTIKVIYNGIDTDIFFPDPSKREEREIRVLFSGHPTRRKGAHWLPAIADRLNSGITIYYTSGLRDRGMISPRLNLLPVGPIPYARMPEVYNKMDILLMPTVREGFGLAVAEAMACGLPVVASNCSAIPELVDDTRGGFLCSVGDVAAFADKINTLAESPSLRKEMGAYNRTRVEKHFTIQKMIHGYSELFETLC